MNIVIPKKNLQFAFFFPFFSILLILLGGCTNEETNEKEYEAEKEQTTTVQEKNIPFVEVEKVGGENYTPEISLSGTIVADEEITIAAEASGIIDTIEKKEGEKIKAGQSMITIYSGNNLALSAYNSALIAAENNKYNLSLQKKSAEKELENVKIAQQQAQEQYEKEKNSNSSTKQSIEAQTENAKTQIALSEKNLAISKTALSQLRENEKKLRKNIVENTNNTVSQTLVNFRSTLNMTDELLGASSLNRDTNNEFEVYLEGTTVGILLPTQDLWRQTNPSIEAVEKAFRAIENSEYTKENEEEILKLVQQTEVGAKSIRTILRKTEEMLVSSIASPVFPQTKIDSLKAQIVQYQNTLEQNIAQLSTIQQSLSDFHLQSPQRIINAELKVSVAESQVLSSKSSLSALENSENVQKIGADFGVSQAKNNVRTTLNAIDATKIKTDLAIQGAKSQYDSSTATLRQAEISLSKLTIRAPINGTITNLLKEEGENISIGTPVAVVADFSTLKLKGDISVEQRLLITEGLSANVYIEETDEVLEGKISLISPEADNITKRVPVEITFPNKKNIPANLFATARITLPTEENIIFLPRNSIYDISGDSPYVYIAEKEGGEYKVKKRTIQIGRENENNGTIEITEGIQPTDIFLKEKDGNIKEGNSITVNFLEK